MASDTLLLGEWVFCGVWLLVSSSSSLWVVWMIGVSLPKRSCCGDGGLVGSIAAALGGEGGGDRFACEFVVLLVLGVLGWLLLGGVVVRWRAMRELGLGR